MIPDPGAGHARPARRAATRATQLALVGWLLAGTLCAGVWLVAWVDREALRGCEDWLAAQAAGAVRGDLVLHALSGFLLGGWVAVGCRLFAPRFTRWLPFAVTLAVSLGDEGLQAFDSARTVEFADLIAAWIGLGAAVPLVWWLGRSRRGSAQRRELR